MGAFQIQALFTLKNYAIFSKNQLVAILSRHNVEILNKMDKKIQVLLKPREPNLGSIYLKVTGIKVKSKSDQMMKIL